MKQKYNNIKLLNQLTRQNKNIITYLKDYKGMTNGLVTYKRRDGLKVILRAGMDRNVYNEIFLHKAYEREGFEIKPGDTVVDIGGHIGCFSLKASQENGNGKIFTIEPELDNFKILWKNVVANQFHFRTLEELPKVSVFNYAIGGFNSKSFLHVSPSSSGRHSLMGFDKSEKQKVEVFGLDYFLKKQKIKKVDYLKIDCEGAEYDILENFKGFEKIKKIVLEYHDLDQKRTGNYLVKLLRSKGYKVFKKITYDGNVGYIWAKR